MSAGEGYAAAAARELEEELGIRAERALEPLFKLDASVDTGFEFVWVYRTTTTAAVHPDPVEILEGRWCAPTELTQWLVREPAAFTASFRLIWSRLHSI